VDAVWHLTGVGAVQVSLNDRRVTASIAAIDETSGYAVAVYTEAHGRPTPVHGAVAMPLGLISEVCHKDIKKRRRKLNAGAGAAAKCRPLHALEHFVAHDGELGRVIRGSAATAQDCRLAQPTLVGFTCDELMQKTLTDHVVFHDKWSVRAFHVRMYPLGGDDRMACDALMGGALRCAAAAEHVGVLSADGTFCTTRHSQRIVRNTLFGDNACLGFGNSWSEVLTSRDKLFYRVNATPDPDPSVERVVTAG
jgi:hypothetical protein